MKPTLIALTAALTLKLAAPASAYGLAVTLPNLSFPETPSTPDVGQGCVNPATLTQLGCAATE